MVNLLLKIPYRGFTANIEKTNKGYYISGSKNKGIVTAYSSTILGALKEYISSVNGWYTF